MEILPGSPHLPRVDMQPIEGPRKSVHQHSTLLHQSVESLSCIPPHRGKQNEGTKSRASVESVCLYRPSVNY